MVSLEDLLIIKTNVSLEMPLLLFVDTHFIMCLVNNSISLFN